MRRRLLALLLVLLAGLLGALMTPLAQSYAARQSQELFITRLNDTFRFAVLAETALRSGRYRAMEAEMRRYDELYGVAVVVVDVDGRVVAASRTGPHELSAAQRSGIATALLGRPAERPATAWPWRGDPYVVGEPVGRDSLVLGAVVTVSPTTRVRQLIAQRLVLLSVAGLAVLVLAAALVALPAVRMVLRPVQDLDAMAREITRGRLDTRVSEGEGPRELRGLASSFNAMADSVSTSLEQQRALVADASHQLRNPLAALRLRVENLEEHVDPAGAETLQLALDETERLSQVLDSLLRLARAEVTQAERSPVDLATVAHQRAQMWGPLLPADTPVRVEVADSPEVLLPPTLLEQVLDALLDNAVKFAAGAEITLRVLSRDAHAELHVMDRGPGLDNEGLERAGERFWRGRAHQNVDGTGLGLAIVRALLNHCGGELRLVPVVPHGLDAAVILPARDGVSGPPRDTTAPPPDAAPAVASRSPSSD